MNEIFTYPDKSKRFMKDVKNKTVHRVRFNDYEKSIHIQYRGSLDGKHVGWSEIEKPTREEYFKRKLEGK